MNNLVKIKLFGMITFRALKSPTHQIVININKLYLTINNVLLLFCYKYEHWIIFEKYPETNTNSKINYVLIFCSEGLFSLTVTLIKISLFYIH